MTGELGNKIDSLWEIFWNGGITNPLDVVEQMTYLMFIKDLDDTDNLRAKEAAMLIFAQKKLLCYKSIFADEVEIGDRKVDGNQLKDAMIVQEHSMRMKRGGMRMGTTMGLGGMVDGI